MNIVFSRKSFPRVDNEEGKLKVSFDLSVVILLKAVQEKNKFFNVHDINCIVDNFNVQVGLTSHDMLFNLMISLFSGTIREKIEDSLEDSFVSILENMNHRVSRAMESLPAASSVIDTLKSTVL
jgi:hypothetical protein